MRFGKVLVGYDGSGPAQRAVGVAAEIARKYGGDLLVLTVFNPAPLYAVQAFTPAAALSAQTMDRNAREWQECMEQHAREVLPVDKPTIYFLREIGSPADKILEIAEREQADLIVVGSRGVGGFERMLLGSVSEGIVHHAMCPVMVIR